MARAPRHACGDDAISVNDGCGSRGYLRDGAQRARVGSGDYAEWGGAGRADGGGGWSWLGRFGDEGGDLRTGLRQRHLERPRTRAWGRVRRPGSNRVPPSTGREGGGYHHTPALGGVQSGRRLSLTATTTGARCCAGTFGIVRAPEFDLIAPLCPDCSLVPAGLQARSQPTANHLHRTPRAEIRARERRPAAADGRERSPDDRRSAGSPRARLCRPARPHPLRAPYGCCRSRGGSRSATGTGLGLRRSRGLAASSAII